MKPNVLSGSQCNERCRRSVPLVYIQRRDHEECAVRKALLGGHIDDVAGSRECTRASQWSGARLSAEPTGSAASCRWRVLVVVRTSRRIGIRKPLPTENLLEDTDVVPLSLDRKKGVHPGRSIADAADLACCSLLLLTCAFTSHSQVRRLGSGDGYARAMVQGRRPGSSRGSKNICRFAPRLQ